MVRVRGSGSLRPFRLIVGSAAFAQGQSGGIDLVPKTTLLHQNYPNPFNPSTTVRFELATAAMVRIEVYDILGRLLETLVSADFGEGYHEVEWIPMSATGIHFCRLEVTPKDGTAPIVQTRKMMFVK